MWPSSAKYFDHPTISTTPGQTGSAPSTGTTSLLSRLRNRVRKLLHGEPLPSMSDLFLDSRMVGVSATSAVTSAAALEGCTCTPYSVRLRRKPTWPVEVAHVHRQHCPITKSGKPGLNASDVLKYQRMTAEEVLQDMFPNT